MEKNKLDAYACHATVAHTIGFSGREGRNKCETNYDPVVRTQTSSADCVQDLSLTLQVTTSQEQSTKALLTMSTVHMILSSLLLLQIQSQLGTS